MAAPPLIALLSDFGLADGYVGVLKGVILGIAPGTQLLDLTHDVPPQDVRTAAWILATAWRSFPVGAIFLCVVDPGVGTARRHPRQSRLSCATAKRHLPWARHLRPLRGAPGRRHPAQCARRAARPRTACVASPADAHLRWR